jgi:hypothetical protein
MATEEPELAEKPPNTPFKQQRLPAWQPVITFKMMVLSLVLLGVIMVPLGAVFCYVSSELTEISMDYTGCLVRGVNESWTSGAGYTVTRAGDTRCEITFQVGADISGPVYLYYALTGYYQNHRLYAKSVSADQLAGQPLTYSQLSDCVPLQGPPGYDNVPDAERPVYYPCGLVANSLFNDTISSPVAADGSAVNFTSSGISWSYDKNLVSPTQYSAAGSPPVVAPPYWTSPDLVYPNGSYKQIPNLQENEHFLVWIRIAGLPCFRKLYAQWAGDLPAGTYTISVDSVFDVLSFGGTKSIVITNQSFLGGKNSFIGIAYIVVGAVFLLTGIALVVRQLLRPKQPSDPQILSWSRSAVH